MRVRNNLPDTSHKQYSLSSIPQDPRISTIQRHYTTSVLLRRTSFLPELDCGHHETLSPVRGVETPRDWQYSRKGSQESIAKAVQYSILQDYAEIQEQCESLANTQTLLALISLLPVCAKLGPGHEPSVLERRVRTD